MKSVAENSEAKTKSPRILLIDDDPFSWETVEAQLFQDGYEIMFRNNGSDAVRQVSTLDPDVILLDLMMPGISGFEVCQQIKGTPQLEHIPIILFSALDGAENVAAGLEAGADEFLTKPVSRAELRARIRSMLRIKQQYNELQQTLERREAFLRVLAHDMRNPLAGIVLYAQLLEKRGELSPGQKQYLHMVQAEAQQLRLLLDQMQLLSRLHQGEQKIRPQLTDFRLLLREVTHKYFPATELETAELTIKLPSTPMPRVLIDRTLLKHLLEILISNAMRFTPRQSTVTLELTTSNVALSSGATPTSAMIENGHYPNLQMIITDQGPPIPETALQILYEHVERWDILAPERAGMGVGLALCKMIAEINAGRLETTNCSPVGVRYTLELPIPETEWNPHHQGMIG